MEAYERNIPAYSGVMGYQTVCIAGVKKFCAGTVQVAADPHARHSNRARGFEAVSEIDTAPYGCPEYIEGVTYFHQQLCASAIQLSFDLSIHERDQAGRFETVSEKDISSDLGLFCAERSP